MQNCLYVCIYYYIIIYVYFYIINIYLVLQEMEIVTV